VHDASVTASAPASAPLAALWTGLRRTADAFGATRFELRLLVSLVGYAITAGVVWWQWSVNFGGPPPDLAIWDRVGDQVRLGISPYSTDLPWDALFFYSPPWALVFGATSWLPELGQAVLIGGLSVLSLRYVAGSWLRVGYLGLIPLTGGELGNGSFNLVLAAAIAMAVRGDGRLATFTALAKFSPILAVRDWRRAVVVLVVCGLVTLPVLAWWGDWLNLLLFTNQHYAIGYPISFPLRLAAAVVLLVATRDRPWARVVAATIAVPALYSYSFVLLYALVALPRGAGEKGSPGFTAEGSREGVPEVAPEVAPQVTPTVTPEVGPKVTPG
jgi:hypothetical protein